MKNNEPNNQPHYFNRKPMCPTETAKWQEFCKKVWVSNKPTYPSPKPTLILTPLIGQNVGLGEGKVGSMIHNNLLWYQTLKNWWTTLYGRWHHHRICSSRKLCYCNQCRATKVHHYKIIISAITVQYCKMVNYFSAIWAMINVNINIW